MSKFTTQRDYALEEILRKCSLRLTEECANVFSKIEDNMISSYSTITSGVNSQSSQVISHIKNVIDYDFLHLAWKIVFHVERMNKLTFALSYSSEIENIARLKGKLDLAIYNKSQEFGDAQETELLLKVRMSLEKLKHKIFLELDRAYLHGETPEELRARFVALLPEQKKQGKRKILAMEAAGQSKMPKSISLDQMNDDMWNDIVDEYQAEYIPLYRNLKVDGKFFKLEDGYYNWELENVATNEFVQKVKDGTVEAANQSGVTDFLWIAVIDQRTREEHILKNGLTSSEIEKKLKDEWAHFDDHSIVPPGGFNCRCRAVPYVPEVDENAQKYGNFDEWINE